MKVKYSSEGGADILASLGRLGTEQLAVAKEVSKKFAREVVQDARSKAPKRTGALRRAIHHKLKSRKGSFEIGFGWRAKGFYGLFVEYGTKKSGAKPHLRPAFDSRAQTLETDIANAIEGLMK